MYHIHHTEAFVLGHKAKGEDSKIIVLYTRELGLIYAHAQGIRKLSSKLRFTLQDFSRVNVDLVRGKEIWRITTASPVSSYKEISYAEKPEKIIARIASLVVRLVKGEEANEEVFKALNRAYDLLSIKSEKTDYKVIELLSVARILIALGYLSRDIEQGEPLFNDVAYQHRLIRDINQALAETQL